MKTKSITLIASLALVVAGLGSGTASAHGSCPEARTVCQPTGGHVGSSHSRIKSIAPKQTPKPADSQGKRWRAGSHFME